jgi:hypothetical protein
MFRFRCQGGLGLLLALIAACCSLYAQDTTSAKRVSAQNVVQLRSLVGQEVVVTGDVSWTSKSRGGHQFLHFHGSDFSVVCFRQDLSRFPSGAPADAYRDQRVEVRGRLNLYRDKPQIKLQRPEQIRVVSSQPTSRSGQSSAGPERTGSGDETWISPRGLRYTGRDPDGRTRLEHVLRHTQDQPERDGPHGVFDGGRQAALAVIDEAWRRAEERKIRPRVEGERSSYLVPMGRRVGYLGGKVGQQRGHPPLFRVFIVFRSGTREVVTAFPR